MNHHLTRRIVPILVLLLVAARFSFAAPTREEVLDTMKRAAGFMMDAVSTHGGFVEKYTEDLSERWGEIPARNSMIWVQEPGTVTVGRLLLDAYKITDDDQFLRWAERTAGGLIMGQRPEGGWDYFFDFEPDGLEHWYREIAVNCWGWEEFYHCFGNSTFDDNTTVGAADFLLELYLVNLNPAYRAPLLKALDMILESQYPEGGWPQRYPPSIDKLTGEGPGYTAHHTFNDGVIPGNIEFLLKAYEKLGDERYKRAALRGMYFVILSQMPPPQAGWADQYDLDLQPAGARSYEPLSVMPSVTASNIRFLLECYKMTGDRRFLRGIPDALDWLDECRLPPGHAEGNVTHPTFAELGTNRPLYPHREGTSRQEGRYYVDYEPGNFTGHYGEQVHIDVDAVRREYARVAAMSPEEAHAEYLAAKNARPARATVDPAEVESITRSMDARGAWIEELSVPDYTDWRGKPRRTFRGISVRTFVKNMRALLAYLEGLEN